MTEKMCLVLQHYFFITFSNRIKSLYIKSNEPEKDCDIVLPVQTGCWVVDPALTFLLCPSLCALSLSYATPW